jgi:hypothetical protein
MAAPAGIWSSEDRVAQGTSGYGESDHPDGRKGTLLFLVHLSALACAKETGGNNISLL